jgi:hypothetical protein
MNMSQEIVIKGTVSIVFCNTELITMAAAALTKMYIYSHNYYHCFVRDYTQFSCSSSPGKKLTTAKYFIAAPE